jgi:hypothetical protein
VDVVQARLHCVIVGRGYRQVVQLKRHVGYLITGRWVVGAAALREKRRVLSADAAALVVRRRVLKALVCRVRFELNGGVGDGNAELKGKAQVAERELGRGRHHQPPPAPGEGEGGLGGYIYIDGYGWLEGKGEGGRVRGLGLT